LFDASSSSRVQLIECRKCSCKARIGDKIEVTEHAPGLSKAKISAFTVPMLLLLHGL
jgi:hypothetical protein